MSWVLTIMILGKSPPPPSPLMSSTYSLLSVIVFVQDDAAGFIYYTVQFIPFLLQGYIVWFCNSELQHRLHCLGQFVNWIFLQPVVTKCGPVCVNKGQQRLQPPPGVTHTTHLDQSSQRILLAEQNSLRSNQQSFCT